MEITPKEISKEVLNFCKLINTDNEPRYIVVEQHQDCKENHCYENVKRIVADKGGTAIAGWVIWKRDNMYLEAEAHAVWKTIEGNWIDVSPHTPLEQQIFFLPDKDVKYDGTRIPNRFFQLTGSESVREFIELVKRIQEIEDEKRAPNGRVELSGKLLEEYREKTARVSVMNASFDNKVGRNDPCPCGSGLKYKRCCGRYR